MGITLLSSLPNEIIFEILCRVPLKSLCLCRCVSRGWCALISGPDFIAAQKSHPAEPFLVVTSSRGSCLRLLDLDGSIVRVMNDMSYRWAPLYMSPVDDVLCVTSFSNSVDVAGMIDLSTMVLTKLELDGAWGCGRAVPSGAYKVVRFNSSLECEVLTVGDGDRWRKRKYFHFHADYSNFDNDTASATVNGTLHFMAEPLPDATCSVLRFDLESEEWMSSIKGPPNVKLGERAISLGELNGSLCMVEPDTHDHNFTNVWLLTDSEKSIWIKKYKIPLDTYTYYNMKPLRVLEDGSKLLLRCNKLGEAPVLKIYDHGNSRCTDAMENLLGGHARFGLCSLHLESIISHKIQYAKSSLR